VSKEETPPIIRWLHRYIFRGAGLVFWAGSITNLYRCWRVWAGVLGSGALASHFVTATLLPGQTAHVGEMQSTSKETRCQLPRTNEKSSRVYFS
jgi:hypothetical protein